MDKMDSLMGGAGEDPAVMRHIDIDYIVKVRWSILKDISGILELY